MRKVLLIILDGWGHSDFKESPTPGNAIEFASVPHFRELYDHCPRTRLACSGVDVGLPADQMGNSEVGHLHLGAGRRLLQDLPRIDASIASGDFFQLSELLELQTITLPSLRAYLPQYRQDRKMLMRCYCHRMSANRAY